MAAYRDRNSNGSSDNSDHGESSFPPYDQSYQQISRMADEFEEEFKQFEPEAEFGGRQTSDGGESGADPSDPRLIDISSTQALVAREGQQHDGSGEVKGREWPKEKGKGSDDVEEGELSDSSSEQRSANTEGREVSVFYDSSWIGGLSRSYIFVYMALGQSFIRRFPFLITVTSFLL